MKNFKKLLILALIAVISFSTTTYAKAEDDTDDVTFMSDDTSYDQEDTGSYDDDTSSDDYEEDDDYYNENKDRNIKALESLDSSIISFVNSKSKVKT